MKIFSLLQFLLVAGLVCFFSATTLVAESVNVPKIETVTLLNNIDSYPLIEIRGTGFGREIAPVQLIVNDGKAFATIVQVKNKKILAQLPSASLCSGTVEVRVFVNKVASKLSSFLYNKGTPVIYNIEPQHAEAGMTLEIKADNLSCQAVNNLVTFNDMPVPVLGLGSGSLSVKVPDNITPGTVTIRVTVASSSSLPNSFSIDSQPVENGETTNPDNAKILFNNTSGVPGAAGFTPMFNIKDVVNVNSTPESIWNMNFYGTHQAIVKAPWKTVTGSQQLALVSLDCRYNTNLPGNLTGRPEKYVYILVSYPRDPEQPYHPIDNPFFWGTLALCSESLPRGEVVYNSLTRSNGGIDFFEISKTANTVSKFSITATVIALDLGYYYEYGLNFSKAGGGKVSMPKVAKINITVNNVEPLVPMSRFHFGDITLTDESGTNGSMTTTNTEFKSKLTLDDITFFGANGIF
jgi:hypothetical protein